MKSESTRSQFEVFGTHPSFEKSGKFMFHRSNIWLTYPQTGKRLTPLVVLKKWEEKVELYKSLKGIKHYLISQEKHKDGNFHIHAYLEFQDRFKSEDSRFADLKQYNQIYHPYIQKPINAWQYRLFRYIKKDKLYITNLKNDGNPTWFDILDIESRESFLEELLWQMSNPYSYSGTSILKELWVIRHSESLKKDPKRNPKQYLVNNKYSDQA